MIASCLLVSSPVLQAPPTLFFFLLLGPSLFLPGRPPSPRPWGLLEPERCLGILCPHLSTVGWNAERLPPAPSGTAPFATPLVSPRLRPFGLAPPLTGLGVHGEVALAIQHAVHQSSAAAVRGVIRIRGHHLHHRRAWARGTKRDKGQLGPLCSSSPWLPTPRETGKGDLGRRSLKPIPSQSSSPHEAPTRFQIWGLPSGTSMTMESDLDSNLPSVVPSCKTLASEDSLPASQFPHQQNGDSPSPWFMREHLLISQCRTQSSISVGGGNGYFHQLRSSQS